MSRRAVKRYEEALEAEKLRQAEEEQSDSEEDGSHSLAQTPPGRQNLFALLGADNSSDTSEDRTDSESENNSSAEVNGETVNAAIQQNKYVAEAPEESTLDSKVSVRENDVLPADDSTLFNPQIQAAEGPVMKDESQNKKKRRRRKKRNDNPADRENDPDWAALNENDDAKDFAETQKLSLISDEYFCDEDGSDVREEAQRIMAIIEEKVITEIQEELQLTSTIIQVEPRLLNADTELKRMFGSRAVDSSGQGEDAPTGGRRRRGRALAISKRNQPKRRVTLVTPREIWAGPAPGLVMVVDDDSPPSTVYGVKYFRYHYEAGYKRVQDQYRQFVEMNDPNLLVDLCSHHPYHVDSLLQLAELQRQMGELERAASYVERALYVLECAWNISFKPYDGQCRLRFDVIENRSLYVALFRYSQLLTRRGLHRTALEICKLLLNLNPEEDPMGVLLIIDSLALLSGENEWICQMRHNYSRIPLELFPNFVVSDALAKEALRVAASTSTRGKGTSKNKENKDQVTTDEVADNALIEALLTYPMVLRPLLTAIQDTSDVWTEHRLFDEAWYGDGMQGCGTLSRVSRVYAERSKSMWSVDSHKAWLIRCARKAGELDTAAGMGLNPDTGRLSSAIVSDEDRHSLVARCRTQRAEAGRWFSHSGLYQKVQIADFTDSAVNIPAELLGADATDHPVGAPPPRDVGIAQSALEFIQSLLPWRDVRDAGGS